MKNATAGIVLCAALLMTALLAGNDPPSDTAAPGRTADRPVPEIAVVPLESLAGAERDRRAAALKIRNALGQRVDVKLNDVPLSEALADLENKVEDATIRMHREALQEEGVATDEPVTLTCRGATLGQVLFRLLTPLGLTWVVRDEALLVTTQVKSDELLTTRVRNVARLTKALGESHRAHAEALTQAGEPDLNDPMRFGRAPPQSLDDIILDCVLSGGASDDGLYLAGNALVARTRESEHAELEWFLKALEDFVDGRLQGGAVEQRPSWSPASDDAQIREALAKPVPMLDARDVPLADVVERLGEHFKGRAWIDKTALIEEGVDTEERVDFAERGIATESALGRMLHPLGLTAVVECGFLKVTTQVKADESLRFTLYDVRDLLDGGLDELQIVDAITNCTSSGWDSVDWIGDIRGLPLRGALLVRQDQGVHREIAILLSDLRAALAADAKNPADAPRKNAVDWNAVETKFYPMNSPEIAAELAKAVPLMIAPDTWTAGGGLGVISTVGRSVAVRHTRRVHNEIRRFLNDQDAAESRVPVQKP